MQETFWTVVGAIGTVSGAIGAAALLFFIYRQIKTTKDIAAYEFLRKENDRFRTQEMRRHRRNLAHELLLNRQAIDTISDDADYVLGYFEDLGLLLKKGLAPDFFVWTMNSYWILRYWHVLKHYIDAERKESDDETYYSEFEALFECMLKHEKKERRTNSISFSPDELGDFLRGQLGLRLRPFMLADLSGVMEIEKTSFGDDAYPKSRFKRLYNRNPVGFVIADVLGEVVGYAVGNVTRDVGEIDSLAVHSHYRRLGIGQELLEYLIDRFRASGMKECTLEVRTTNKEAIGLYEKLGFQLMETLPNYYSDRGSAFLMKATLDSDEDSLSNDGGDKLQTSDRER